MYWTVKTLKIRENDSLPTWVPVDEDTLRYDTYQDAVHAHDEYRAKHPNARLRLGREQANDD